MATQTIVSRPIDEPLAPPAELGAQALFLIWGPPSHGPRSRVFAQALGISELHYIYSTRRRGWLAAPLKYPYQAAKTMRLLFAKRPKIVFVQSPPSFAVLFVYIYCLLTNSQYLIDAHSAAFQRWIWTRPRWLQRFLARQAIATIVTNEYFQQLVERRGGRAFVLRDIPTSFDLNGTYPLNGGFNIAVVNSFAKDEPLDEVLAAAGDLADVNFYVTGKQELAPPSMLARAPANVRFTGFLPDATYYALLNGAHAVVCLTTRDHTMQRGACEALSLGRPIITSDWPLLKMYFHKGTIHVPNTGAGIRQGVLKMQGHHAMYQAEIKDLQIAQQREWREKIAALTRLIEAVVNGD